MKIRINGYELEGEVVAIRELLGFDEIQQNDEPVEVHEKQKADVPKVGKSNKAKKPQPKKPIDDGKIGALHKAGWSVPKIADEMRLSAPTIRKHLKEMGL